MNNNTWPFTWFCFYIVFSESSPNYADFCRQIAVLTFLWNTITFATFLFPKGKKWVEWTFTHTNSFCFIALLVIFIQQSQRGINLLTSQCSIGHFIRKIWSISKFKLKDKDTNSENCHLLLQAMALFGWHLPCVFITIQLRCVPSMSRHLSSSLISELYLNMFIQQRKSLDSTVFS